MQNSKEPHLLEKDETLNASASTEPQGLMHLFRRWKHRLLSAVTFGSRERIDVQTLQSHDQMQVLLRDPGASNLTVDIQDCSNLELLENALETFIDPDERIVVTAIADEARRVGGPLTIGREKHQHSGEPIIEQGQNPSGKLRIVTFGSFDVFGNDADGHEVFIETIARPTLIGEISALKFSKPTATIRTRDNGSFVLTFPAQLFKEMYDRGTNAQMHQALNRIMQRRLGKQRERHVMNDENSEATLKLIADFSDEPTDASMLDALSQKVDGKHLKWRVFDKGKLLYEQNDLPSTVCVLTSGRCEISQYGIPVTTAEPGAIIGDLAFLEGSMPFSVTAGGESGCTVLEISADIFRAMQDQLLTQLRAKSTEAQGETDMNLRARDIPAATLSANILYEEVMGLELFQARNSNLMMSALPRVGDRDSMLLYLSKLGLLRINRLSAKIVGQSGAMYQIQALSDTTTFEVDPETLASENLDRVLGNEVSVQLQLDLFSEYGFDAADAIFILTSGYILPTICTTRECQDRLEKLRERLPDIRKGCDRIDDRLRRQHPELASALKQLLFDFEYPLTITTLLANDQSGDVVIDAIQTLMHQSKLSEGEFRRTVEETIRHMDPAFMETAKTFDTKVSVITPELQRVERSKQQLLRSAMQHPAYSAEVRARTSVSSRGLSSVEQEIAIRTDRIQPELQRLLGVSVENSGVEKESGFPFVSCRTKTAAGVADKIQRMRRGNAGKEPRPDYDVIDAPDITGGRIIATDIDQLKRLILSVEATFAGRIIQKDNFYVNEAKRMNPYRVITYTVLIGKHPCEIQLSTLHASIAADVIHNISYKTIAASSLTQEHELSELWRHAALYDLQSLIHHNQAEALGHLRDVDISDEVIADFSQSLDFVQTKRDFIASIDARFRQGTLENSDRSKIIEMMQLAEFAHQDQTYAIRKIDKATGRLKYPSSGLLSHVPYINHSVRVARYSADAGLSADAIIAALFHDTLEDQPKAWNEFVRNACPDGARLLVESLSEVPDEPREQYMLRMQKLKGEAKLVKGLDRLDNLLRGHTMLSPKYLRRTLQECKDAYDDLFDQVSGPLVRYRPQYVLYRQSIERLSSALEAKSATLSS
jgi:CRP-like cAMP-binding protein/ppGpp synthetase/RelA/SpoT-type nucleotidyltranferase